MVVGAGEVGCRKLADLLESDVERVLVLDAQPPSAALMLLLADVRVRFVQRDFTPEDLWLDGKLMGKRAGLVFATTGHAAVNAAVVAACAEQGILCNSADAPDTGGFIVPARVCAGRVTLAVSTQGASPALARHMRQSLQSFAEPYAALAELLARLRPMVLAIGNESGHNRELFRTLVTSPLGEALAMGDIGRADALLRELLPKTLHPRITELLS